jgi:hypothetical protein
VLPMSESSFETTVDDERVRTGDEVVDGVLDQLGDLDGASVDDHVAIFELAHEHLRRALDATS